MAWTELDASGSYFACFRFGGKRFKRSLKTSDKEEADDLLEGLRRTIRDVERGRLQIPKDADVATFLLSDGRAVERPSVAERLSFKKLFDDYFAGIPAGSMELSTIYGMKLHRKHLEKHFRPAFDIQSLTLEHLQRYVASRPVSGGTSKKEVVTLRTVWNWGVRSKLLEGPFPAKGLKYPKVAEKPPFTPFAEVEEKNDESLWDCVYLTVEDIDSLLKHVKETGRGFIYPMFVFAAHTGARRSEIMRARVSDVDLKNGWVTIHERKRVHDRKTTRRVPLTTTLHQVLTEWLKNHPNGQALFCHEGQVERSKKRSPRTGYKGKNRATTLRGRLAAVKERQLPPIGSLTKDEMHDHFKRALAGSRWENLKGWHVFRHSFISALATNGVDQRIIDDAVGHCTEEQRRRYRHLFPATTRQIIAGVFG